MDLATALAGAVPPERVGAGAADRRAHAEPAAVGAADLLVLAAERLVR